jgi:hypothetical protein
MMAAGHRKSAAGRLLHGSCLLEWSRVALHACMSAAEQELHPRSLVSRLQSTLTSGHPCTPSPQIAAAHASFYVWTADTSRSFEYATTIWHASLQFVTTHASPFPPGSNQPMRLPLSLSPSLPPSLQVVTTLATLRLRQGLWATPTASQTSSGT